MQNLTNKELLFKAWDKIIQTYEDKSIEYSYYYAADLKEIFNESFIYYDFGITNKKYEISKAYIPTESVYKYSVRYKYNDVYMVEFITSDEYETYRNMLKPIIDEQKLKKDYKVREAIIEFINE